MQATASSDPGCIALTDASFGPAPTRAQLMSILSQISESTQLPAVRTSAAEVVAAVDTGDQSAFSSAVAQLLAACGD